VRASDIVNQLSVLLPQLTNKFTTDVAAKSISRSGTVMTAVCNDKHKLQPGQAFAIVGTDVPIPIASITKSGNLATLITTTDHDLTNLIAKTIRITGATEAQFNGTFTTVNIINRRTISFTVPDTSILSYDNQLSKFESEFSTILNESNIVTPVQSLGSLKATAIAVTLINDLDNDIANWTTGTVTLFNESIVVRPGGIGGSMRLEANLGITAIAAVHSLEAGATNFKDKVFTIWMRVDAEIHALLIADGTAIRIRISSTTGAGSNFNEYHFPASLIPFADTFFKIELNIATETPAIVNGTIILTAITDIRPMIQLSAGAAAGDTSYWDDIEIGSNSFNVKTFQVGGIGGVVPVDMSTLTALSFWVFIDSDIFNNLTVTDSFRFRISSDITLGTDWNEYRFDKSVFTADTWVQLFIDIANTTPDDTAGAIDLTKIVSLYQAYIGIVSFALGDSVYFNDLDKGLTIASGSPVLRDAESALRTYNTTHKVDSVVDEVTFKFAHSVTGLPDPDGTLLIRTKPRISSGINIDRIKQLYTKHGVDAYWAFVVIDDVNASQSRLIASDALDNQQRNVNYRQQIIESFTVYVIIPVSDEIAAVESRDIASDLLRPFLRSLLFSQFSTGLYADKLNRVQFTGHGVRDYDTSVYIHAYSFQQVAEIYEEDTVGPDLDIAMRDIDFKMFLDFGTQIEFLRGTPDLDDTPL